VTDNRRTKRYDLRLPVELVRAGGARVSLTGETKNLSSGGVLFSSDTHIDVGEPIEYYISLPTGANSRGGVRLRCLGKVRRLEVAPTGTGKKGRPVAVAATLERYEFIR
jgi:hypothetical protein